MNDSTKDCIFCRIARKELPSQIVLEQESCLAFRDVNPQAPVHILIVSKRHLPSLAQMKAEDAVLLGQMQWAAAQLAEQFQIQKGFRLVLNNGRQAGQSVDHLHYHLLGGRRLSWPPG